MSLQQAEQSRSRDGRQRCRVDGEGRLRYVLCCASSVVCGRVGVRDKARVSDAAQRQQLPAPESE